MRGALYDAALDSRVAPAGPTTSGGSIHECRYESADPSVPSNCAIGVGSQPPLERLRVSHPTVGDLAAELTANTGGAYSSFYAQGEGGATVRPSLAPGGGRIATAMARPRRLFPGIRERRETAVSLWLGRRAWVVRARSTSANCRSTLAIRPEGRLHFAGLPSPHPDDGTVRWSRRIGDGGHPGQ